MATVELTLTGPDGANPLGFLCALGILRTLSNAWPDSEVKMKWQQIGAPWRPVLRASHADLDGRDEVGQKAVIVNAIFEELKRMEKHPAQCCPTSENTSPSRPSLKRMEKHPAQCWNDTHDIPPEKYREYASKARDLFFRASNADHRPAEWAAALACDVVTDGEHVEDTAFRTMSGQGHQHFLKQIRSLQERLEKKHIDEALFGWQYQDEKLNLRFDPSEDRRHALRWKSPDKDPIKTVWGANRLAAEGLPLCPVFPAGTKLKTTGFRGSGKDDTFWTWPIWSGFLSVAVVRSILALPALQADKPPRGELSPLGIVEVYRTQRITVGKYRAFTPPIAI
ncbi:MAG: hypothetical protein CUN48_12435 [Candidatus Thermofonsia Clade 3 bacterium]|jgi:hypothetical protein|uniref:Type I-U CRISPR-associated protein Csx17 n=1 Tax=Candidatus Thermofonsia Clade 3 bacterium TaxID=2364212 RepID=A0A2M8QA65_9CHLR|nr:hypothetical protein [Candidatus Roseilinea sp. NK_OTU-006]PJF46703.1 MAG: hypothetical protein CUN48_12435 [Candidatus Thermofonsia Clade 3 bacterium]